MVGHPYNNSYLYFHVNHMGYVYRNQHGHILLHGVDHRYEHLLGDHHTGNYYVCDNIYD
jgi:hypothetical protein